MTSVDLTPGDADVEWPRQSWFLRGPLLTAGAMIASLAALVTELCVMLIAGEQPLGYVGLALSASGFLVILRARWVGLALTTAGAVASALLATEFIGIWSVAVFAMFIFARQGGHVLAAAAVAALALYAAFVVREGGSFDAPIALVGASFCIAAAAAGSAVRLQAESWEAARRRALDLAVAQAGELRQAVTDERLRIARDLHDVVGHELAVVNINVGVAEVSLSADADDARHALSAARAGLQRTLQETQQILDLLRAGDAESDRRGELALIGHIPSLIERFIAAGGDVEAVIPPDLPELDAGVSAAAYRIVQEALTNAEKHGAGRVSLTIDSSGSHLLIDVRNRRRSSAASATDRTKYGLVGMRERTASAGGAIEITQSDDTFSVHVELPTKASTS